MKGYRKKALGGWGDEDNPMRDQFNKREGQRRALAFAIDNIVALEKESVGKVKNQAQDKALEALINELYQQVFNKDVIKGYTEALKETAEWYRYRTEEQRQTLRV